MNKLSSFVCILYIPSRLQYFCENLLYLFPYLFGPFLSLSLFFYLFHYRFSFLRDKRYHHIEDCIVEGKNGGLDADKNVDCVHSIAVGV